jgi:hypothetical protein
MTFEKERLMNVGHDECVIAAAGDKILQLE